MLIFDDEKTKIHRLTLGPIKTNGYIVESGPKCFLIDPVGEAEKIISYLKKGDLRPDFLLATHGHFDHIAAAYELLKEGCGNHLYICEADITEVERAKTMSLLIAKKPFQTPAYEILNSKVEDLLNTFGFEIMKMPGHTKGSIILFRSDRKLMFSGDLIINNLVVNAKPNPGEDAKAIHASILQVEKEFKPETLIFPGHGAITRLDVELKFNKMIQYARAHHG